MTSIHLPRGGQTPNLSEVIVSERSGVGDGETQFGGPGRARGRSKSVFGEYKRRLAGGGFREWQRRLRKDTSKQCCTLQEINNIARGYL